jgi:hypothetical protein
VCVCVCVCVCRLIKLQRVRSRTPLSPPAYIGRLATPGAHKPRCLTSTTCLSKAQRGETRCIGSSTGPGYRVSRGVGLRGVLRSEPAPWCKKGPRRKNAQCHSFNTLWFVDNAAAIAHGKARHDPGQLVYPPDTLAIKTHGWKPERTLWRHPQAGARTTRTQS